MEIVDGEIRGVDIDANESPEIGQLFIPVFENQIMETQSANIDVVAGATITSVAVRDAARNCVAQAQDGVAPLPEDDCISPIEPAAVPDAWDYEAEVVVVGASMAGVTCAAKLAENGVGVIVVEKEGRAGGGGRVTSCIGNYGGNKVRGDEPAYFADVYHDQDVMDYFQRRAHWTINNELLRNSVISLRECYDWMYGLEGCSFVSLGTWWSGWKGDYTDHTGTKHGSGQIAFMAKWVKDTAVGFGAEFLWNTPAKRMVQDGDAVVGIEARDPDGNVVYIKATRAVVLAADNMQRNPKMLKAYAGLAGNTKSGLAKGTGEVIRMGQGVGADMAGLGSFAAQPGQPIPDGTRALMQIRRGYDCLSYLFANPWCRFDKAGTRAYYVIDRLGSSFGSKGDAEFGPQNDMIECFHEQSASDYALGDTFAILDSSWRENYAVNGSPLRQAENLVNCDECKAAAETNANEYYGPSTIEESFDEGVEHGLIYKADTLEELAGLLGVDPEVVANAVARWNADCEAGQGDWMHGYSAQNMTKVENGPFFGARITPGLYASFAGLKVTPKNEVVDGCGNVIPGLYAAFHTAGGIAGESQVMCPMGDQIGSMIASGYTIAKALIGETWEMI